MTDFSGMIAFAQSLAETVKQAQTATEALAAREADLAEQNQINMLCNDRINILQASVDKLTNNLAACRNDLAASEARNAEVSEALARANAKLDSFRQLLGVDSGTGAPVPTPAVLPEQPTNPVAEPANEAQPVDHAPAPGTGGVEPHDPPQVNQTAYDFVIAEPASTRHVEPQSEPTPAPEVAEPRPTPPEPSHPISDHSGDDRFGQAQEARPFDPARSHSDTTTGSTQSESSESPKPEGGPLSWRDSASHVPYRAFSY